MRVWQWALIVVSLYSTAALALPQVSPAPAKTGEDPVIPPPEGAQTSPISGEAASVNLHGNPAYEKAKLSAHGRAVLHEELQQLGGGSLGQLVRDTIATRWVSTRLYQSATSDNHGFDAEPTWNPTEDEIRLLIDGIPYEYLEGMFDHAVSRSHAYAIRDDLLSLVAADRRIEIQLVLNEGGSAIIYNAIRVLDPVLFLPAAIVLLVVGRLAFKHGRMARTRFLEARKARQDAEAAADSTAKAVLDSVETRVTTLVGPEFDGAGPPVTKSQPGTETT